MKTQVRKRYTFLASVLLAVSGLVLACVVWVKKEQRQYALNRHLIAALVKSDIKQARVLVETGADPNTRCAPTPAPSILRLMNLLLQRSPPANDSPTAFMLTCGAGAQWQDYALFKVHLSSSNRCGLASVMLAKGANLNAHAAEGETALDGAVNWNLASLVALLIDHGARVESRRMNGSTSLMVAASAGEEEIVRLLLALKAQVNVQNQDGNTALHFAVTRASGGGIVRMLLAHGARTDLRNVDEETALTLAAEQGSPDIRALLRQDRRRH